MRLLVYNPEHDEALAADVDVYTPCRAARRQIELWRDKVLPWQRASDFRWVDEATVPWDAISTIVPFGWDRAIRHRLCRAGAPERLLPSDDVLYKIRQLSSRRTAVKLLRYLRPLVEDSFGVSFWMTSKQEVDDYRAKVGRVIVKAPWSCAGRGVFFYPSVPEGSTGQRIERIIRTQGGVVVEPFYADCKDFALEWHYEDGRARCLGVNVFSTDRGQFKGSLPIEALPIEMGRLLPLMDVVSAALPLLLKDEYAGPLGVDMMCDSSGMIHPCVEINLRQTMADYTPMADLCL